MALLDERLTLNEDRVRRVDDKLNVLLGAASATAALAAGGGGGAVGASSSSPAPSTAGGQGAQGWNASPRPGPLAFGAQQQRDAAQQLDQAARG